MKFSGFLLLVLFLFIGCFDSSKDKSCRGVPGCKVYKRGIFEYPMVYDKDIDSLAYYFRMENLKDELENLDGQLDGKKVIVIFVDNNGKYLFDGGVQNSIPDDFQPKSFVETDYIILRTFSASLVGRYDNNITSAYSIDNTLFFIDPKSKEVLKVGYIGGGSPPNSITYRRKAPTSRSSAPSTEEIVSTIIQNLKY